MSLTARFADSLASLYDAGPADGATEVARILLLDGISIAALGAREPGPAILRSGALASGGHPVATVIGAQGRLPAVGAALVNGAAMHVLDYEPMWNPANHSLSTVLPAVLSLAEQLAGAGPCLPAPAPSGQQILRALTVGIEAQARLRRASGMVEPEGFVFHPPSTVGPLGSAVACGLLLELNLDRLVHAIGIAASTAGGLQGNIGSMTKALHCGRAAGAGLEAALLAARGFTADTDILGSPHGYARAFFGGGFDASHLTTDSQVPHSVDPGPAYKLYPSQYGTHFVITAALQARKRLAAAGDIRRVVIHAPVMSYTDRPAPATGLAGKFSFQYVAAVALLDGDVTVESFSDARRFAPDVEAMLPLIEIDADPDRQGRFDRMRVDVSVELRDGRRLDGQCDGPPGIWGKPADPGLLRAKALACLTSSLGATRAEEIVERSARFETMQAREVADFVGALGLEEAPEAGDLHGRAAEGSG